MNVNKIRLTEEQRERLREIRKNSHKAAEDISVQLGYSKAWLGQIERGKLQTIKKDDLQKLADIFPDVGSDFLSTENKKPSMTITEILEVIHQERVELEVCQALQQWLLTDRAQWIDRAMDSEATVRAIHKIAKETKNPKNALQGIITLSEEE